jgi:hypothetical protein
MVESEVPLLTGNSVSIAANDLNKYYEVLRVTVDPNRIIYIRDINWEIDDTTSLPQIKISVNGTPYLKDFPLYAASGGLGFGGNLRGSDTKDPVIIQARKTSAGAGILNVSCTVTGIQIQKVKG